MAYYQARSGVCRSGVTYCGWTPPAIGFKIAGTDRIANVVNDGSFVLTLKADGTPAMLTFTLKNLTPSIGQDVAVLYAGPNEYLFGGTLLQAEAAPQAADSASVLWHCTAVGYQWLLDRYDRVLNRYQSTGVGTMVADILARYTDGSFRVGYIPSSLGNLDMDFTFETVTGALNRIAKAVHAFWSVQPFDGTSRIVDLYDTYPETALATVTESLVTLGSFAYRTDLTQVRTRTIFQGSGSTVTLATAGGSSTIPVDDFSAFSSSGGTAISGRSLITYTGTTTGLSIITNTILQYLTGVSGLLDDLAQGDPIDIIVTSVDAAATTALATRLGGGLSGQATNYLSDGRLSATEAANRGATDLAIFDAPLEELGWTYKAVNRGLRVGRSVTVSITNPVAVSGSFLIQVVTWKPYGVLGGTNQELLQTVAASRYVRSMTDLLSQLPG